MFNVFKKVDGITLLLLYFNTEFAVFLYENIIKIIKHFLFFQIHTIIFSIDV